MRQEQIQEIILVMWVQVLLSVVCASIVYVLYWFCVHIYVVAWKFRRMDPTLQVYVKPFTGILGLFQENIRQHGDSHFFAKELVRTNPDQRAFFTNVGYRPYLILSDARLIKELTANPKKYRKFNMLKHSSRSYTKGIFFAEDEDWHSQRRIISHNFSFTQLKRMIEPMVMSIDSFITHLKTEHPSKEPRVFRVLEESQLMIGEILVRIFFSQAAINKKVNGKPLSLALAQFTIKMFQRSRSAANIFLALFLGQKVSTMSFTAEDRQLQHQIEAIRTIILEILDARMAQYGPTQEDNNDFLDNYIGELRKSEGTDRPIEKEEVLHQLITFYFAGIDTTGHLAAFAFYSLAEYPQYCQRIRDEITTLIPNTDNLTFQQLQKMQFTGRFLNECLRMWPPAIGVLTRVTREEVKIGPFTLPKGMLVGTNMLMLMHNPKHYDNPHIFNPDRWDPALRKEEDHFTFIPFSAGMRSCIGKYLALMEVKLMIIKFLANFNFARTKVPLRLQAKFLYQPIEEDLISLTVK